MIALAIFIFALVVIFFTKIQEPQQPKHEATHDQYSCYSFRHFKLGMLAIAVYGAVEVCPPTYILAYLTSAKDAVNPGLGMDAGYVARSVRSISFSCSSVVSSAAWWVARYHPRQ